MSDETPDEFDPVALLDGSMLRASEAIPVNAVVIAEMLDPESGDVHLHVIHSKGLHSWQQIGMLHGGLAITEQQLNEGWEVP